MHINRKPVRQQPKKLATKDLGKAECRYHLEIYFNVIKVKTRARFFLSINRQFHAKLKIHFYCQSKINLSPWHHYIGIENSQFGHKMFAN